MAHFHFVSTSVVTIFHGALELKFVSFAMDIIIPQVAFPEDVG